MKKICIIIVFLFFVLFPLKVNASEATCHYDFEYTHNGKKYNGYVKVSYKDTESKLNVTFDIINEINRTHDFVIGDLISENKQLKCKDKVYFSSKWENVYSNKIFSFSFSEIKPSNSQYDEKKVFVANLNPNKSSVKNDSQSIENKTTICSYKTSSGYQSIQISFDSYGNLKQVPRISTPSCSQIISFGFTVQDLGGKCPEKLSITVGTGATEGLCGVSFCKADSKLCVYREDILPNEVIGTEQNYNGKKCYITSSNKVSTCRDGEYTKFTYENGEAACANNSNKVKKIIRTENDFDNYFDDEKKTPVCPTGYKMYNEYCYQCLFIEDKPDGFDKDCSVFVEVTRPIWRAIRIVAPILAVVLGAFDFLKATAASDEKEMKKATSNFVKRLIMLALLFLLTYIVNFIVGLANGVDLGDITKCL